MPRPLKPTNPYASWTALFSATLQRLRQELPEQPAVTQAEFGRRVYASGSKVSAIERGQVRPDAAFVEACERELPAGVRGQGLMSFVVRAHMSVAGQAESLQGTTSIRGLEPVLEPVAGPVDGDDLAVV